MALIPIDVALGGINSIRGLIGCGVKDGIYTIADCMNERFRNKIDILETIGTPLYKFKNVKIIPL